VVASMEIKSVLTTVGACLGLRLKIELLKLKKIFFVKNLYFKKVREVFFVWHIFSKSRPMFRFFPN